MSRVKNNEMAVLQHLFQACTRAEIWLQQRQRRWSKVHSDLPHTTRSLKFHQEMLEDTDFDTQEHPEIISKCFDKGLKKVFSDDQRDYCVEFGTPEDDDPDCGIEKGKLMLTG